ncbi:MAG: hypothetical protein ACRC2V_00155 [Xenococcaceae cyanobacterium]
MATKTTTAAAKNPSNTATAKKTTAKSTTTKAKTTETKKSTPANTTTSAPASKEKTSEKSSSQTAGLSLAVRPHMIFGNRPVEPSHLQIVNTYRSVGGDRPVTTSGINVSSTLTVSGNRPIAVSTLQVSESYIMGNRPIASNEIDDPTTLMGFID